MQMQRLTLQERLQHIGFKLLHNEHQADDEQGGGETVGHQGDQSRQRSGDDGTDDRDEPAEEGEDRQRRSQRNAENDQTDTDQDRIDEGDEPLHPDVLTQDLPDPS